MPQAVRVVCFIILLATSPLFIGTVCALEIRDNYTGVVGNVVDGDTFRVTVKNGTEYAVRLADLDASELGQAGYEEAKDLLYSLVYGKTVYLDVDDVYVWDSYGKGDRLVCVVYVDYNTTHLQNVNKALVDTGIVEMKDYENEFNPNTWGLYVSKEAAPEFPFCLFFLCAAIGILIAIILFLLRRMRA